MNGFTIIELILVILLIGIVATVAIPKYMDIVDEANKAARDGMVGAAMSAVSLYFSESITVGTTAWPSQLTSDNFEKGSTFVTDFGGYTWTYSAGDHSIITNP